MFSLSSPQKWSVLNVGEYVDFSFHFFSLLLWCVGICMGGRRKKKHFFKVVDAVAVLSQLSWWPLVVLSCWAWEKRGWGMNE